MSSTALNQATLIPIVPQTAGRLKALRKFDRQAAIYIGIHCGLALLIQQFHLLASIQAGVVLLVGLWWAYTKAEPYKVACVGGYIIGAEVLWRMTSSPLPWEFGKYAVCLVFLVALLRRRYFMIPPIILFYFLLLLPATVPTLMTPWKLSRARQVVSFSLSGPFALLICAWFFSYLKVTPIQIKRIFLAIIGPIVTVATYALISTLTHTVQWGTQSNLITSGGFGPNQVSGALGLGALMSLLFLLKAETQQRFKLLMFLVMIFLAIQCALTFSRGGLVGALGAGLLATFCFVQDRQSRLKVLLVTFITLAIAFFILIPSLDSATGGALTARFQDTDTSGRNKIIQSDLKMWSEHPIFGIGVGFSKYRDMGWVASHTEFSRLLSEHGLFGLGALILLMVAGARRVFRSKIAQKRALAAGLVSWSYLFMAYEGMRLAAPSFIFGMAFITLMSNPTAAQFRRCLRARNARNKRIVVFRNEPRSIG